MDHRVLLGEGLVKGGGVCGGDHAEALAERAVEAEVRALLRAALDQHRANLHLLPRPQLELHQLVRALVDRRGGHDRQVDGAAKVDEILLGHVRHDHWLAAAAAASAGRAATALVVIIRVLLARLVVVVVAVRLVVTENLLLDLLEELLVGLVIGVVRKVVEVLAQLELLVEAELVRDLVVGLDERELREHAAGGAALGVTDRELGLAQLEELLNHVPARERSVRRAQRRSRGAAAEGWRRKVGRRRPTARLPSSCALHSLVDLPLVQDRAQSLEDGIEAERCELVEGEAAFGEEGRADLQPGPDTARSAVHGAAGRGRGKGQTNGPRVGAGLC